MTEKVREIESCLVNYLDAGHVADGPMCLDRLEVVEAPVKVVENLNGEPLVPFICN